MKINMKFFGTIASVLMVLLAVTAITASAAEYTDANEIEHKEAVSGCSELGIVDGRDLMAPSHPAKASPASR